MNVGRMGSEAREARRRELEAEKVSIHVAMDTIFESFNNADETYEVRVENDTIKSCSCLGFRYQTRACKHMFFLTRCAEHDVWRAYTEVASNEGRNPKLKMSYKKNM
ncbi:hypothetical protein BCV71DRAFT_239566 [Rhizopus microsporus]|uniref:SWIM-type domain-containing protein n=1 Tax=Rhizopus microsporus TaxID=58291 RepID=A0A1X0RM44_RHIZD|nr:hypothetical protein BCV71DRAFT_239566 [Rhizopus microsporus]